MRSKTDSKIKFRDFFFQALKEEIALLDKLYFSARLKRIKRENGGEGTRELLGQAEKIVEIEKKVSEALE